MKQTIIVMLTASILFMACKKNAGNTGSNTGTNSNLIAESSVPFTVLNAFNASFGTSTERAWRHGKDQGYMCQFNFDDQRHEAQFDDDGHQSSHSVICIDEAVPSIVLNTFDLNFPTDIVYEWKLNNDSTWKAHFFRGTIKWEVTINSTGNIIKSEHD